MADEPNGNGTQEGQPNGQQGGGAPDPSLEQHPDTENLSLDEIKKLKAEHKGFRDRVKKLEDLLVKTPPSESKTPPDPKLLEAENLKATLEAERKSLQVERQIFQLSPKLKIEYPDLVLKVLSLDDVEFDDSGKPTNVESLLKEVLKQYPKLGGGAGETPAGVDAGKGGNGTKPVDMNDVLRRATGRGR